MSAYAEIMQAVRFTTTQNKLILYSNYNNAALAHMFGRSLRAVQRQRAMLRSMRAAGRYF
jgi:uncharacterized membrane protein